VTQQPNILLVITDQQRADTLACNGNVFTRTPHADALAKRGVNFANAFTPFPVCTPARATMWTGAMPHAHGVVHNRYNIDDVLMHESKVKTTIFDQFRDAGYTTAYFGKWHLGEKNCGRFDVWDGFNSRGGHWEGGRQSFQGGEFKPNTQTRTLCNFLAGERAKQAPFIAVQSFYPPHHPFTAPTEFYEAYRGKGVPFAGYYAAVSALDDCLGRIVATLEAEGLSENTLVVFFSDHGETFDNHPERPHKFSCSDGGIKVPFVMAGAGVRAHSADVLEFIGLEDLPPTLLSAAGIAVPEDMHGRSIFDLLHGCDDWRDFYYVENETLLSHTIERAVRTRDWKLILRWDETHELYHLESDPEEVLNVFGAPRKDIHDQYLHYDDTRPTIIRLAQLMLNRARELADFAGVELASHALRRAGAAPENIQC
jgi:arylsulfatase A-like enzyme